MLNDCNGFWPATSNAPTLTSVQTTIYQTNATSSIKLTSIAAYSTANYNYSTFSTIDDSTIKSSSLILSSLTSLTMPKTRNSMSTAAVTHRTSFTQKNVANTTVNVMTTSRSLALRKLSDKVLIIFLNFMCFYDKLKLAF